MIAETAAFTRDCCIAAQRIAGALEARGVAAAEARDQTMDVLVAWVARRLLRAAKLDGAALEVPDPDVDLDPSSSRALEELLDGYRYAAAGTEDADVVTPDRLGDTSEAVYGRISDGRTRGDAGVYYTGRAEIELMCRLALAAWLGDRMAGEAEVVRRAVLARSPEADRAVAARGLWPRIADALSGITVLDPACGSGSFLVGMERLLAELGGRAGRPVIPRALCGMEVKPWAVRAARLRLGFTVTDGKARPAVHIQVGDSLLAPKPAPVGDCDLVIGNPPFVRHERIADPRGGRRAGYKGLIAEGVTRAHPEFFAGRALDGRSDLFLYFYFAAFARLKPDGILCFLSSAAWLDARYGASLRAFLVEKAELRLVLDHETARSFGAADVNTVIVLAAARPPLECAAPVPFVSARVPWDRLEAAPFLDEKEGSGTSDSRALRRAQRSSLARHVEAGWGGPFLRAPAIWWRILEGGAPLLALDAPELGVLRRGRRTGRDAFFCLDEERARAWRIEARFLRPLVRSPVDFLDCGPETSRRLRMHHLFVCDQAFDPQGSTAAAGYLRAEESRADAPTRTAPPWYRLVDEPPAELLLPIAFHDRCFVVRNDARCQAHQRFATLRLAGARREDERVLAAVLSSTLIALQCEVLGRRALGQGVLDFPPESWRHVRVPDPRALTPSTRRRLEALWQALAPRPPSRLAEALRDPARRELDTLVLELVGQTASALDALYDETLRLLEARLAKAARQSTGPSGS